MSDCSRIFSFCYGCHSRALARVVRGKYLRRVNTDFRANTSQIWGGQWPVYRPGPLARSFIPRLIMFMTPLQCRAHRMLQGLSLTSVTTWWRRRGARRGGGSRPLSSHSGPQSQPCLGPAGLSNPGKKRLRLMRDESQRRDRLQLPTQIRPLGSDRVTGQIQYLPRSKYKYSFQTQL